MLKTFVPVMSDGIRSGVNWMRENCAPRIVASVLMVKRLGRARNALDQRVALGQHGDEDLFDDLRPARRSFCEARSRIWATVDGV